MKNFRRILSLAVVLVLSIVFLVACGEADETGDGEEVSVGLELQNNIVIAGESNAFLALIENADDTNIEIDFQVKKDSGQFKSLGKSVNRTIEYKCIDTGSYTVKAVAEIDGNTHTTDEKSFNVVAYTFGVSPNGDRPTKGIDYSRDSDDVPAIEHIALNKASDEFTYYRGINTANFILSADVDILAGNSSDKYPKAGFFVKNSAKVVHYFFFDVRLDFKNINGGFGHAVYVPKSTVAAGFVWEWGGSYGTAWNLKATDVFRENDGSRKTNRLTLIRDGADFYIYVNDVFLAKRVVEGFTEDTVLGTYTISQNAIFSDYSCFTGDSDEYTSALQSAKAHSA